MSKYQVIYDDRNYDFPTCGGFIVKENLSHMILEVYSNYSGKSSGIKRRRKKAGIKAYQKKTRIDWGKWDFFVKDVEATAEGLATLIGCDVSTVRERRRFLTDKKGKYARPQND